MPAFPGVALPVAFAATGGSVGDEDKLERLLPDENEKDDDVEDDDGGKRTGVVRVVD